MPNTPLVSVIVPTYNSAAYLEACLASIKAQRYSPIELIVVDNHSKDATTTIAKKYTQHVYSRGPERSAQRNFGVQQSTGTYVCIIDSDMHLTPDVITQAVERMQSTPAIQVVVIPEESFGEGFWATCKKLERSLYVGVPWIEAGRFFRKETFTRIGGYDENNTGTEDYDLPQRILATYGSDCVARTTAMILHNEQRINLWKTCKKKFYYAQRLSAYTKKQENREAFGKQSSLLARYALFFRKPKQLFRNPVVGVGMLFMKTCEFAAGGAGFVLGKLRNT